LTSEQMNLLGLYIAGVAGFYTLAFVGAEKVDSPNLTRLAIILWPLTMVIWLVDFIWEVTCDIFWTPPPPVRGGHIMPRKNQK